MLVDGIKLFEGSSISNASVETGSTFPTTANAGELFFKTTDNLLYVYNGTGWVAAGSSGAVAASALTGTSLASNVISSSLTSVGTLTSLAVSGNVTSSDPTTSSQLATKNYVDNAIAGLTWKNSVLAATTANITLSGTQTVDGVALVAGNRVLVKNQSSAAANGIYVVAAGAWTRATDFDGAPSVGEINGAAVYVQSGTVNNDTTWTVSSIIATVGTDAITFAQLSAAVSVAASGLTGTTLASNVVTSSLTSVGTLSSLAVTGTASAGSFSGAGTGLTGTASGLSIGGNAATASAVAASALTGATLASGVTASSLTSVGTLTGLTVNGTLTATSSGATAQYLRSSAAADVAFKIQNSTSGFSSTNGLELGFYGTGTADAYLWNYSGGYLRIGTNNAEQLRILSTGAWSVGSSGSDYGTSGQVLTSNGNARPTWQSSPANALGGTTLAPNVVSSSLTSFGTVGSLTVGGGSSTGISVLQEGGIPTGSGTGTLRVGYLNATITSADDAFVAWASANASGSQAVGGNGTLVLAGRNNVNTGLSLVTGGSSRLYLNAYGAFGLNGANYGTSGQVLTSGGSNATPTWSNFNVSNLVGTTLNSSIVTSSLTTVGNLVSGTTVNSGNGGAAFNVGGGMAIDTNTGGVNVAGTTGALQLGYLNAAVTSTQDAFVAWGGVSATSSLSPAQAGGTLILSARNAGTAGVSLATANTSRLYINNVGAFGIGGANYGTSGQVLTSNGSTGAPSWQAAGASAASSLTGTTLASNVVASSLTSVGTLSSLKVSGNVGFGTTTPQQPLAISTGNAAPTIEFVPGASLNIIQSANRASTGYSALAMDSLSFAIRTTNGTTPTERFAISSAGEWQLAGAGGSSGQVLTSSGTGAAPTWTSVASVGGSTTQIQYNSAGAFGATARFTYTDSTASPTLTIGDQSPDAALQMAYVKTPDASGVHISPSPLTVMAGNSTNQSTTTAADLTLSGGNSLVDGSGTGGAGSVYITGGRSTTAAANGFIVLKTTNTERFRITPVGAWSVGTGGTATGTSGQVLTSNGSTGAPTWQSPGASAASALTGTTLASNVVSSSLTSVGTLASLTVTGNVTAADPTISTHLATKAYVDTAVNGLTWKTAVAAATTGNITLSGAQTIDGVSVVAGNRVLVKNQTTGSENGIYVVAAGAWTRSTDMDGAPSVGEVNGAAVYVTAGTTLSNTAWTQSATITTVGTDTMVFAQFAATGAAAANTLSGTTLASNVVASSLTSVGTLSTLTVSGITSINGIGATYSATLTTSATTAGQVVDNRLTIAAYRAVKYNVSVTSGTAYHFTEVTVIHDGTNVFMTENGTVQTGASLATFTADISGGNLRLLTTPTNAVTTYKVVAVAIAV